MDIRLIVHPAAGGAWNMAVDEALLERAGSTGQRTLRFYAWAPATLSLGYFQSHRERDQHAASQSLPLVRRASGGGAIVHHHELTYSFATPLMDRFAAAEELVCTFHQALRDALREWHLEARLSAATALEASSFLCFQRRARYDLLVGDHKIGGSAQRRHRGAGLIHGSVLLARSEFAPELPGLREMLPPRALSAGELSAAWTRQLSQSLSWHFTRSELDAGETDRARYFQQNRFHSRHWNRRR